MVFFLHCLNSTVKVMKGLPWRIGVAKDHAIKRPAKTMRKDHENRPCKETMRKDHEKKTIRKTTRKDHEKRRTDHEKRP